jgi:hypothetical protein
MQTEYLTKSDFKVAQTCPTKLYYRKQGYPTTDDGDESLALLADQGYLIEALARALFPDGRWVGFRQNAEQAVWDTMVTLGEHSTLFEATFISRGKMARVDILVRRGNVIELIEIKSCSFDRRKNDALLAAGKPNLFRAGRQPERIRTEWRPYLEDAAFQVAILQEVFPEARVVPYLLMPDSSSICAIDRLHQRFALRVAHPESGASLPSAEYTADQRELRRNSFLARVNVADEVELILPEVRRRADQYAGSLRPRLQRLATPISTHCGACEFHVGEGQRRGFHDCWGTLADVSPHILDLYRVREIGSRTAPLADQLIAQGKASLFDVPERQLRRRDGVIGEHARRQRMQIAYTRLNQEWVSDEMGVALDSLAYPLHFVDFETCTPAVPRYRGMRPFEMIAFQWASQIVSNPDAQPQPAEWLQASDAFPNVAFAAALRRQVGDHGSILVWSSHEATILATIRRQLVERGEEQPALVTWLDDVLSNGRLVDMNRLALKHYFHPRMGGRTTLKVVADAVWRADPAVRARLPQYAAAGDDELNSPYQALPPLSINGRQMSVTEGPGAILAYYAMMERATAGATLEAHRWGQLLRQYCQLDTLAMVMIWWRWRSLVGQAREPDR